MNDNGHRRAPRARAALSFAFAIAVGLGAPAAARATATFVINNRDPASVGFNDATPVASVGGNSGQTLGEQRMNVFRYAADTWGRVLDSPIPIVIDAHFAPLDCGSTVTLGQAAAVSSLAQMQGLPANTFFPEALAERIAGRDLSMPAGSADIDAVFNGDLKGCDASLDWYYGLDAQSGSRIDLAAVVLHELAHGLGFSSMVDLDTGAFPSGIIDTFSAHIFDNGVGKSWSAMTSAQRATSVRNVRHLVWDGAAVMAAAPQVLATGAPLLVAQPAVTGLLANLSEVNFGPLVATMGAMGPLFVGSPVDGCSALVSHPGSIMLLQGGAPCSPLNQAANAEKAGARGVLLTDGNDNSPPSSIELPPSQLAIVPVHVPVVAVTLEDGQLLANSPGVTVTLSADTTRLVGADEMGRPYLYASDPIRPGSSVSHWDELERPHLLEEPESGFGNGHDITMETAVMRDIGWALTCGNAQLDAGEQCDDGTGNSDSAPNACRTTCRRAACGDGVVDSGEACDAGFLNGGGVTAPCRTDCTLPPPRPDAGPTRTDASIGVPCDGDCTMPPLAKGGCACSAAAQTGAGSGLAALAIALLAARALVTGRRRARRGSAR